MGEIKNKYFRLISRLDIKNENLIKGIHLEGLRVLGNPNTFAKDYYNNGIDEIYYQDAVASLYGRNSLEKIVEKTIEEVFVPITIGGGIRSLNDAAKLFSNGADKISINSAAVKNPNLISEMSACFGSQSIVVSIDAKKIFANKWEVYVENGREKTGLDVFEWLKIIIEKGAGEIIITSIDKEGTIRGCDVELIKKISEISTIPVIASGGVGKIDHIIELLKNTEIEGLAIASSIHYKKINLDETKRAIKNLRKVRFDY